MTGVPDISVVIPVHNGRRYLGESIESVLGSSGGLDLQVVVVDDGSNDGSGDLARSFGPRLTVVRIDHSGEGPARNRGVQETEGRFLAFVDADDLVPPERFQRQTTFLRERPEIDAVFGRVTEFVSPEVEDTSLLRGVRAHNAVRLPTAMLIRRDAFHRVGTFNDSLKSDASIEWGARMIHSGIEIATLDDVVLERRLHPSSASVLRSPQTLPRIFRTVIQESRRAK